MFKQPVALLLIYMLVLSACDTDNLKNPRCSFVAPFPKANKQLSNLLGETLHLKSGDDTVTLHIRSDRNNNLITRANGDTVFYGQVSKFRQLYFLTEKRNDSSYHIYAIKVSRNRIYGLNSLGFQLFFLDDAITKGFHNSMVQSVNHDSSVIRLRPDKKELRKFYSELLNNFPPDTIIQLTPAKVVLPPAEQETVSLSEDPEEYSLIKRIYPNPVKKQLHLETEQPGEYTYEIISLSGNTIKSGSFNATSVQVNVSDIAGGIYLLRVYTRDESAVDVARIVKHD